MGKRYQTLMPVVLPLALVFSVLFMVKNRTQALQTYRGYMQAAEEYAAKGILTDAIASYEAALALDPSLETSLAVGELYMDNALYNQAEDWYEDELLEKYPKESATYAFGIRVKLAQDNTREAYQVYDAYQERGLKDEAVEAAIAPLRFSFDLLGNYQEVRGFSGAANLAAVRIGDAWGYIDTTGAMVISNVYQSAGDFSDLAPVVDQNGEAFFIDAAGNKKLSASYFLEKDPELGAVAAFGDIQSGMVLAGNGTVWNYYDATTHEKLFGGYQAATVIANGVGAASRDGKAWALLSADGQEVTPAQYQGILVDNRGIPCCCNAVFVQQDDTYRLVDRAGQPLNDAAYEDACAFNENSWAAVQKAGKWLFVNAAGEEKTLGDFEKAKSFSVGIAPAMKDGRWGYIDEDGEWVIEPQFLEAEAFTGGAVAFVKTEEEKWRLLSLYRYHHG